MAFLTKSEVRQAAQSKVQRGFSSTTSQVFREAVQASRAEEKFDIFLSHASEDAEIVLGVREILVAIGLSVYIDWVDDPQMDRSSVTTENAEMLRQRMGASKSLIFLTTKNSATSRWMPWELGYFDGHKTGFIGILPIVDYSGGTFSGQEYLGLYPLIEKLPLSGGGAGFCVVEQGRRGYRYLNDFARGQATIHRFNG